MSQVTITLIYDNTVLVPGLTADWGFACLVRAHGRAILFDTGQKGEILLSNMAALGLDPQEVDTVFLSHPHYDHAGGLDAFLAVRPVPVVAPASCPPVEAAPQTILLDRPAAIGEGLYSTGELGEFEQSLAMETENGLAVIAGCSHPGVGEILKTASRFGKVTRLIGGLHGFSDFEQVSGLELICPTHCTQHIAEIRERFPMAYAKGGAGRVFEF